MRQHWLWKRIEENSVWILIIWLLFYIVLKWRVRKGRYVESKHQLEDEQKSYFLKFFLISSVVVYIVTFLYLTLVGRSIKMEMHYELSFLWEYRRAFEVSNRGIRIVNVGWAKQILDNILLFVPMGVLYGEFSDAGWPKAALYGGMFSAMVEVTQLIFRLGLFEFDDIFNNTMGMLIGYGCFRTCGSMVKRIEKNSKIKNEEQQYV